ncbi:MAG TPA: ribosome-associated translation inhibitor RaiA [Candidatus Brocadiia bacterium]|nr:ribosome-associated translation inhibitor RaiA [Candidatus Brocadiia bacterium]
MQISISGRHVEVTEPLKEHARAKAEHLLRFWNRIESIDVTLNVDNGRKLAEFVAMGPKGSRFASHADESDMYQSIDAAAMKLEKQIRKCHDKIVESRVKGSRRSRARSKEQQA